MWYIDERHHGEAISIVGHLGAVLANPAGCAVNNKFHIESMVLITKTMYLITIYLYPPDKKWHSGADVDRF